MTTPDRNPPSPATPVTDTRHVTTAATAVCAHCGRSFTPGDRPGPAPRYCRRSCRQRAYETRAAITASVAVAHHLDAGLTASGRVHALDPAHPDPRADGNRPTLCGASARPNRRPFSPSPHSCTHCARSAASRTVVDHVPASDLARLLAVARDTSAALDRSHDQVALRLIHAIIKVEQHLTRDRRQSHHTAATEQPDT